MTDRATNVEWTSFVMKNKTKLINLFSEIYKEFLDQDQQQNVDDEQINFFAIKELMKLQY